MVTATYNPGVLVKARGREWVVLPDSDTMILSLRPLSGSDTDITRIFLPLETVEPATFDPPDPSKPGNRSAVRLLQQALMLKLRAGAGPFRSFGNIAVEPRAYQLVPLLLALKQPVIRLLIADDVGIGKTIEAGLVLRELLDRGEIDSAAVLCPPHLCDQWQRELALKFNIQAEIVRPATVGRLERGLPHGTSIFKEFHFTIISLDYIKSSKRSDEFLNSCPDFVIVDEAHSCSRSGTLRHQRFSLLRKLSEKNDRHMLFLTATPHSGDQDSFTNLLSLLHTDFVNLSAETMIASDLRDDLRKRLADHFVQRRRADIEEWQDTSLFPDRQRKTPDPTYKLSPAWTSFYRDVRKYARSIIINAKDGTSFQQRLSWWSALALLRCVSSSPAAAVRALQTRMDAFLSGTIVTPDNDTPDDIPVDSILDGVEDETAIISDVEPGTVQNNQTANIEAMIKSASALLGQKHDPKLSVLIREVGELVKEGFAPVIFCRYIATARYLFEELQQHFKTMRVEMVTGELAPDEREQRIAELNGTKPILVATDCLSEGINLQETFDAVVHYDLSWNPTRHDQREGRVDRFGQRSKIVRMVMIYGEDNPVDGIVLDNILKKVKVIEKELGVPVSMPENQEKLTQAIVSGVLLKSDDDSVQEDFFSVLGLDIQKESYLDAHWKSFRETAKRNTTRFAQRSLKPGEVLPEWDKAMKALGTEADVAQFVSDAAKALAAPLDTSDKGWHLPVEHLPSALRERIETASLPQRFDLHYPPKQGAFVHRTHPAITAIADFIAETALTQSNTSLISRCGAIFTTSVVSRTVIYLLRLRSQLSLKRDRFAQPTMMLAEEAVIIGVRNGMLLPDNEINMILDAAPARDMADTLKSRQVQWALDMIPQITPQINALAKERAEQLLSDHRRVREAANARGSYAVEPVLPADIIGVFVLVPAQTLPEGGN